MEAFRYVVVETLIDEDLQIDKYLIGANVRRNLFNNGYYAVSDQKQSWPEELLLDPCKALYAGLWASDPVFGRYKVQITVRDCLRRELARFEGRGSGESSVEAFSKAVQQAMKSLVPHSGRPDAVASLSTAIPGGSGFEGRYSATIGGKQALLILAPGSRTGWTLSLIMLGEEAFPDTEALAELRTSALGPNLFQARLKLPGEEAYDTFASFDGGRLLIIELRGGESDKLILRKQD